MLIGDLPFGYDPKKNDIIVFSKDGVHLLKIKYDDFVRNVGITVPTVSYTDLVVGEKTKVGELKVGENTYDVNVPPGGMVYTGTSAPSNDLGTNGDLYLQRTTSTSYKYLRFEIYGKKGSNQFTQLSELQFIDPNDVAYDWTNARVHSNIYNYNASQVTQNLISGSTVDVALWQYNPTDQAPIRCDIDCFDPIDLSIYSTYQLWTAGDAEVRDPARWRLSASNDKQNWVELDYVPTYSMPSARNAIGYSKNIASSVSNIDSTFIYKKYYKESDRWILIL